MLPVSFVTCIYVYLYLYLYLYRCICKCICIYVSVSPLSVTVTIRHTRKIFSRFHSLSFTAFHSALQNYFLHISVWERWRDLPLDRGIHQFHLLLTPNMRTMLTKRYEDKDEDEDEDVPPRIDRAPGQIFSEKTCSCSWSWPEWQPSICCDIH